MDNQTTLGTTRLTKNGTKRPAARAEKQKGYISFENTLDIPWSAPRDKCGCSVTKPTFQAVQEDAFQYIPIRNSVRDLLRDYAQEQGHPSYSHAIKALLEGENIHE